MGNTIDIKMASKSKWVEVFPYGVTIGLNKAQPILIFKDQSENLVLPVTLNHADAGLTISHKSTATAESSPHAVSWMVLDKMGLKLEKCLFNEFKGPHQMVELNFQGSDKVKKLSCRANQAMSFCLFKETRFYTTIENISSSQQIEYKNSRYGPGVRLVEDLGRDRVPYIN